MYEARTHAKLTQVDVRKALKVSQGTVSQLEHTATSSGRVVDYANLYGVDANWLSSGGEPVPEWFGRIDKSITVANIRAPRPRGGVAHLTIHQTPKLAPPLHWEDLMSASLPKVFSLVLQDDSMAPRAPAGTMITFERGLSPVSGCAVLLTDRDGNFYFRVYKQKTPTRWHAVPLNEAFLALDSAEDGLTVIGVMTARQIAGNTL